ncbi:Kinase [Hexamita inflata]|uniref:non-specific serine/threonine protein kinase n=1 Tax=Hexamita inflata TaxID=28002 RepID=A0AA86NBM5_9EUKA|nr:Kinase [Hexamita inflata]
MIKHSASLLAPNRVRKILQIGVGAFATVYKVTMNNNYYALKQIDLEQSPEELQQCQREILTMSQLSSPYIIRYFQSYTEGSYLNIIMELGACSLHDVIRLQPLTEKQASVITCKVLQGLEYLHQHQIVHRDIKPQNILLSRGRIQLCDFGISATLSNTINKSYTAVGTPHYAAPEQISGHGVNCSADIWSVGIVVMQMLMRRVPYQDESIISILQLIRQNKYNPLTQFTDSCKPSKFLLAFIEQCLAPVESRPTAQALLKHRFIQMHLRAECGLDDIIQATTDNLKMQQPNVPEHTEKEVKQSEPEWEFSEEQKPEEKHNLDLLKKVFEKAGVEIGTINEQQAEVIVRELKGFKEPVQKEGLKMSGHVSLDGDQLSVLKVIEEI